MCYKMSLVDLFATTQIMLQFSNAILIWKVFRLINHSNSWWVMSLGFALMGVRRITAFLGLKFVNPYIIYFDSIILPLSITILLFVGCHLLYKRVLNEHSNRKIAEDRLAKLEDSYKEYISARRR